MQYVHNSQYLGYVVLGDASSKERHYARTRPSPHVRALVATLSLPAHASQCMLLRGAAPEADRVGIAYPVIGTEPHPDTHLRCGPADGAHSERTEAATEQRDAGDTSHQRLPERAHQGEVGQESVHRWHYVRPHCQLITAGHRRLRRCVGVVARNALLHQSPSEALSEVTSATGLRAGRGCCTAIACGCWRCLSAVAEFRVGSACGQRQATPRVPRPGAVPLSVRSTNVFLCLVLHIRKTCSMRITGRATYHGCRWQVVLTSGEAVTVCDLVTDVSAPRMRLLRQRTAAGDDCGHAPLESVLGATVFWQLVCSVGSHREGIVAAAIAMAIAMHGGEDRLTC